jgi:hypothetical protein
MVLQRLRRLVLALILILGHGLVVDRVVDRHHHLVQPLKCMMVFVVHPIINS